VSVPVPLRSDTGFGRCSAYHPCDERRPFESEASSSTIWPANTAIRFSKSSGRFDRDQLRREYSVRVGVCMDLALASLLADTRIVRGCISARGTNNAGTEGPWSPTIWFRLSCSYSGKTPQRSAAPKVAYLPGARGMQKLQREIHSSGKKIRAKHDELRFHTFLLTLQIDEWNEGTGLEWCASSDTSCLSIFRR
jgi:hypothetical protein